MLSSKCLLGGCALLVATGCGPGDSDGGSSSGAGGATTGGAASGGASSSGGASAGGSSSGGSDGSGGTTNSKTGTVALLQTGSNLVFSVTFRDTPSTATCNETKIGACTARTCTESSSSQTTPPNAGAITFTSPDIGGSIVAAPNVDGYYSSTNSLEGYFGGGEKGHFAATGGDVPAFEFDDEMPLVLLLSQPVITAGTPQSFSRSSDLSLTWSRGTEGVLFYIQATSGRPDGQPGSSFFSCAFPSEAGSGVIPSNILQTVAVNPSVIVSTARRTLTRVGEFDVYMWMGLGVYNEAKDQPFQPVFQ